jgi:hypothetical protein
MKKKSGLFNHGLTYVKGMAFRQGKDVDAGPEGVPGQLFKHFETDHFYSGIGDV